MSVAALMGASVLVTIAILTQKVNMIEIIEKDIEWPTLMFFIFLFILVGAVEESGLLALIADGMRSHTVDGIRVPESKHVVFFHVQTAS